MKRILKQTSKKGFTLLEVMLGVAILAIASTMIMNGFIATMGYSTNTSIYSRVGQTNYEKTINKIATYSNLSVSDRYSDASANAIRSSGGTTTEMDYAASPANLPDMTVYQWRETTGASSYGAYNVAAGYGYGESQTYADNRTSFFYAPSSELFYCPTCHHYGYIGLYRHAGVISYYCRYQFDDGTYCNTKIRDYN